MVCCLAALALGLVYGRTQAVAVSPGTLIVCGRDQEPSQALDAFFDQGTASPNVVLIRCGAGAKDFGFVNRLYVRWEEAKGSRFHIVNEDRGEDISSVIGEAAGVWIEGRASSAEWKHLRGALEAVLRRGGVVGGDESLLAGEAHPGLLPALTSGEVATEPALGAESVVCQIPDQTGLIISGREVWVVGAGKVRFAFPKTQFCTPDFQTLSSQSRPRRADFVAMQRYQQQRQREVFPAAKPVPAKVGKGSLFILGGGETTKPLAERFVRMAGGHKAIIAFVTSATEDEAEERGELADAEMFRGLGAAEVGAVKGYTPTAIDTEKNISLLKRATAVWFAGGRQWRYVDAFEGSKCLPLVLDVLNRGGVVGGTSAGASIQAEYLVRGDPISSARVRCQGYEQGFGLLAGCAIDQHFSQRERFGELSGLIVQFPQLLGIGVDESTALIVAGRTACVIGSGSVFFYDGKHADGTRVPAIVCKSGGKFDLLTRKLL